MNTVLITILVCSASIAREDCTVSTALDVWQYHKPSELACADAMREGQIHFSTAPYTEGNPGETASYIATACARVMAGPAKGVASK